MIYIAPTKTITAQTVTTNKAALQAAIQKSFPGVTIGKIAATTIDYKGTFSPYKNKPAIRVELLKISADEKAFKSKSSAIVSALKPTAALKGISFIYSILKNASYAAPAPAPGSGSFPVYITPTKTITAQVVTTNKAALEAAIQKFHPGAKVGAITQSTVDYKGTFSPYKNKPAIRVQLSSISGAAKDFQGKKVASALSGALKGTSFISNVLKNTPSNTAPTNQTRKNTSKPDPKSVIVNTTLPAKVLETALEQKFGNVTVTAAPAAGGGRVSQKGGARYLVTAKKPISAPEIKKYANTTLALKGKVTSVTPATSTSTSSSASAAPPGSGAPFPVYITPTKKITAQVVTANKAALEAAIQKFHPGAKVGAIASTTIDYKGTFSPYKNKPAIRVQVSGVSVGAGGFQAKKVAGALSGELKGLSFFSNILKNYAPSAAAPPAAAPPAAQNKTPAAAEAVSNSADPSAVTPTPNVAAADPTASPAATASQLAAAGVSAAPPIDKMIPGEPYFMPPGDFKGMMSSGKFFIYETPTGQQAANVVVRAGVDAKQNPLYAFIRVTGTPEQIRAGVKSLRSTMGKAGLKDEIGDLREALRELQFRLGKFGTHIQDLKEDLQDGSVSALEKAGIQAMLKDTQEDYEAAMKEKTRKEAVLALLEGKQTQLATQAATAV